MIIKNCEYCGIEYTPRYGGEQWKKSRFCSHICYGESLKNKPSNFKGKHHSPKTIEKISHSNMGRISNRKGVILSEETKLKIGMGNWKGGRKLSAARDHASRRLFGFIPLNNCEIDGWVGHHIDLNYVIFIPEELHKSIWHSVTKNINMNTINDVVYDWIIGYYLKEK